MCPSCFLSKLSLNLLNSDYIPQCFLYGSCHYICKTPLTVCLCSTEKNVDPSVKRTVRQYTCPTHMVRDYLIPQLTESWRTSFQVFFSMKLLLICLRRNTDPRSMLRSLVRQRGGSCRSPHSTTTMTGVR